MDCLFLLWNLIGKEQSYKDKKSTKIKGIYSGFDFHRFKLEIYVAQSLKKHQKKGNKIKIVTKF